MRTSYPYEILFAGGGNPTGLSSARILRIATGPTFSWVSVPSMSVAKPNIAMASLPVQIYDPLDYYNAVRDRWIGTDVPPARTMPLSSR